MDSVIIGILRKKDYFTTLSRKLKFFCCEGREIADCKSCIILVKCIGMQCSSMLWIRTCYIFKLKHCLKYSQIGICC